MASPLDLHVLSTPPAFVLSQDQTLMFNPSLTSDQLRNQLAKANPSSAFNERFTLSESDCFLYNDFSLYRFQGSPLSFLATTLRIIPAFPCLVNPFFHFF